MWRRRSQCSTLFPYTTLFRSSVESLRPSSSSKGLNCIMNSSRNEGSLYARLNRSSKSVVAVYLMLDRKSTRLNSSHVANSYADFCLKKKNNNELRSQHPTN